MGGLHLGGESFAEGEELGRSKRSSKEQEVKVAGERTEGRKRIKAKGG